MSEPPPFTDEELQPYRVAVSKGYLYASHEAARMLATVDAWRDSTQLAKAMRDEARAEIDALRAKLAAVEAVMRRARHYFPVDRNDALRWQYDDDEDRDDLIAMRRDIDALTPTENA